MLRKLDETLQFLGLERLHLVQLKCFVRPISEVPAAKSSFLEFYGGRAPPVVCVESLKSQALEIEAIAAAPRAGRDHPPWMEYLTPPGMTASPVLARVSYPDSIDLSPLTGRRADRGDLQIRERFQGLSRILGRVRSDSRHLARAPYYVNDDSTSSTLNEIRLEFFDPERPPAALKACVRGTTVAGHGLAVDMIVVPKE